MVETNYHIPGAPSLTLLTDSHNCSPSPILESLRRRRPQLILIAGDFTYGSVPAASSTPSTPGILKMQESTAAMDLITGCSAIAPTYLSLGNHEWMLHDSDLRLISSTGATMLDNTFITTEVDGEQVVIGGLSSARYTHYQLWRSEQRTDVLYPRETYRPSTPEPDLSWLSDFTAVPGYHVLLCHHPEYYHLLRSHSIDLILSGHAHGGQWRVLNHGVWSPGQGFWPTLTSGVHENRLVISRGLTNTTIVPRIWSAPSLCTNQ